MKWWHWLLCALGVVFVLYLTRGTLGLWPTNWLGTPAGVRMPDNSRLAVRPGGLALR